MQYNFSPFKNELKKVEEWLSKEFAQIHTGRATLAVLDTVTVDSYGSKMPVKNVGSISIEDPKTLRVTPWDKAQIKGIEKAIVAANLGLSVATDNEGIRIIFPQLTGESRERLVKTLKQKLEEARISVRREREKVWKDVERIEKEGKMSEDEKFRAKDDLQKIIDEENRKIEELFGKKEKEVLG